MLRTTLLISVCVILFALPAGAQEGGEWSVWVADGEEFYRVFLNGDVDELLIQLPDGYRFNYPSITDDGDQLAVCAYNGTSFRVFVLDSRQNAITLDLPIPEDIRSCGVEPNVDATRLVIATFQDHPTDEHSTRFSFKVYDLATQRFIGELTDEQFLDAFPGYELILGITLDDYVGDTFVFTGPTTAPPSVATLTWNIRTGEIAFADARRLNRRSFLSGTQELVVSDQALTYPSDFCRDWAGLCPNVLRVLTDGTENGDVIFHHTLYPILSPIFAADGQYLLIKVYADATNEETYELYGDTDSVPRWIALDRTGRIFELPFEVPDVYGEEPIGTPDGYIFLYRQPDTPVQIVHHRLTNVGVSSREVLWEAASTNARVLWWMELRGDPSLTPFSELPPVISDMPILVPTTTPLPTPSRG